MDFFGEDDGRNSDLDKPDAIVRNAQGVAEYNRFRGHHESAEAKAIMDRLTEIEREVGEHVPLTVEEFAIAIVMADDDGEMDRNEGQLALAQMAYHLLAPGEKADA